MEELINFLLRNKSTHFNIKDQQKRRVAYHEGTSNDEAIDAVKNEYPELAQGKYVLTAWKGVGKSAAIDKAFQKGEIETLFPNTNMSGFSQQSGGNSIQAMLQAEREKGRQEALVEMRIMKIEEFLNERIRPILKALEELAELDIKTLREGIEALKNDDPEDDEDAIEKLEKFERGARVVKSLMSKSA